MDIRVFGRHVGTIVDIGNTRMQMRMRSLSRRPQSPHPENNIGRNHIAVYHQRYFTHRRTSVKTRRPGVYWEIVPVTKHHRLF